jgi:hypothetical protein
MPQFFCARSGASALIPRRSAAYPREDVHRHDLIEAVMGTVRVSNLLVQGVDVGWCPHPHLYHLGRLSSLCRCSSCCVTHDPKQEDGV